MPSFPIAETTEIFAQPLLMRSHQLLVTGSLWEFFQSPMTAFSVGEIT